MRQKFQQQFPNKPIFNQSTVPKLIERFNKTGSANYKKRSINPMYLTEEKIDADVKCASKKMDNTSSIYCEEGKYGNSIQSRIFIF